MMSDTYKEFSGNSY